MSDIRFLPYSAGNAVDGGEEVRISARTKRYGVLHTMKLESLVKTALDSSSVSGRMVDGGGVGRRAGLR